MSREELIERVTEAAGISEEKAREVVRVVVDLYSRGAEPRALAEKVEPAPVVEDFDDPLRYFAETYANL